MSGYRFGPRLTASGAAFRLWAPAAKRVELLLEGAPPTAMTADVEGWYRLQIARVAAGARYRFRINGELEVPDPASAFQPEDVAGPSEVIDHDSYAWSAQDWRGRPWEETVLIEAHVGTFTPQGTYRAMVDKLDHLVATGITALELMPLADFAGARNWGYDGVLWYAPDSAYGRPEDLKYLIDEAHRRGLMMFLDVVYNHFGPEGNYLGHYAPQVFSDTHTPWGNAIDYAKDPVRDFAIENALHWLDHYRFDGLRLDAVQAIVQQGEPPMLRELSRRVGALAAQRGRHIHLVLENDDNRVALLDPRTDPSSGKYLSQWNDDYHHAFHSLLTGETQDYYGDYAPDPHRHLARMLKSGFAYQGEASRHRGGRLRGEASGGLSPAAFVHFIQNHDQIGNRALGDRIEMLASPAAIESALVMTLLAPGIPLLFMGEEWGAREPFPFFCDFHGGLAEAVRKGRRAEFKDAYARYGEDIPDPLDSATFRSAVLDWSARDGTAGRQRLTLVRELLAIRGREIMPRLAGARFDKAAANGAVIQAAWQFADAKLHLIANLSDDAVMREDDPTPSGTVLWGDIDAKRPPWSVSWILER